MDCSRLFDNDLPDGSVFFYPFSILLLVTYDHIVSSSSMWCFLCRLFTSYGVFSFHMSWNSWEERRTASGRIQYLNHITRTTQWERPTRYIYTHAPHILKYDNTSFYKNREGGPSQNENFVILNILQPVFSEAVILMESADWLTFYNKSGGLFVVVLSSASPWRKNNELWSTHSTTITIRQ